MDKPRTQPKSEIINVGAFKRLSKLLEDDAAARLARVEKKAEK
jgi:hypothetical protein